MPFRDVVGHVRLIDLLSRSVARDSLPPSLIFAGPAGIGKRLTALAVAQALNCTNTTKGSGLRAEGSVDACGTCAACTRIARGVHPDVSSSSSPATAAPSRSIRSATSSIAPRTGRSKAAAASSSSTRRTRSCPPAQNALLKTLEEPPPSSVFILVTARPDMLLPTVRSRCPRLRFRPLSAADIAAALEARGHSEAEARAVAATADGSLGRALEASAGDLVEARDVAQRVLAQAASAADDPAPADRGREGAAGEDRRGRRRRPRAAGVASARDGVAAARRRAAGHPRGRAARSRTPTCGPRSSGLTPPIAGERGVRAFAAVDRALIALDRNAGVKLVADWLVLQL